MARNHVTLHREFARQLQGLADRLRRWGPETKRKLIRAHGQIGQRHQTEAKRRVPVRESRLKQAILSNVVVQADTITTETGTNVKEYPVYLEFGTRFIAGGRVLALGDGVGITDGEAVINWPAKNETRVDPETGKANKAVVAQDNARFARGHANEQMPWLRPAFSVIRVWAMRQISEAIEPPEAGRGKKTG